MLGSGAVNVRYGRAFAFVYIVAGWLLGGTIAVS